MTYEKMMFMFMAKNNLRQCRVPARQPARQFPIASATAKLCTTVNKNVLFSFGELVPV